MASILDVPYRSQWDDDANKSNTDCGPACLAMVLGFYSEQASINGLLSATGAPPGQYVSFGQLQRVARSYGITFQYGVGFSLNDLKRWIDEGKPSIALIRYSFWSQIDPGISTQDTYRGPHFVVVIGYGDGHIYVNDPNYWPPRREEGHAKAWSEELFDRAWSNVGTPKTPNPNNAIIVPTQGKLFDRVTVLEYTVHAGDSWASLAARFYGDKTRFGEILTFNDLLPKAQLYVGLKLRIPFQEGEEVPLSSDLPMVLGEGALQSVDVDLVQGLKDEWISAGKIETGADAATVLRRFVADMDRWDPIKVAIINYLVQPDDTWMGIAGRFLGDQMRYQEIIAYNGLAPDAPLPVGQTLRIPPRVGSITIGVPVDSAPET
jgi:nucleoid-associated protein YgaU